MSDPADDADYYDERLVKVATEAMSPLLRLINTGPRRGTVLRVWCKIWSRVEPNTGRVADTPSEIGAMLGVTATDASRALAILAEYGALARTARGRYMANPSLIWRGSLAAHERAFAAFAAAGAVAGAFGRRPGFVYAVMRSDGLVKIGKADEPKVRLAALRHEVRAHTGCAIVRSAEFAVPDPVALERDAHRALAVHRRFGEWFAVSFEEAQATIQRLTEPASIAAFAAAGLEPKREK